MFLIPCLSGRLALAEKRELETRDLVALELYLILKHNLTSLILYEYFAELLIFITDIWGASGGHLGAESAAPGRSKRIEGSGGGSLVCLFVISTIPILVKFIITLVVIVIFVAITLFLGQSVVGREIFSAPFVSLRMHFLSQEHTEQLCSLKIAKQRDQHEGALRRQAEKANTDSL
jgi:hypothetical protein